MSEMSIYDFAQELTAVALDMPVLIVESAEQTAEERLASYLGVEAVALFSSGGSANGGVLTTLVGAGDVIISDRLNHASIIDG